MLILQDLPAVCNCEAFRSNRTSVPLREWSPVHLADSNAASVLYLGVIG